MTARFPPRALLAAYLAGGNATILDGFCHALQGRADLEVACVGVEMDGESQRYGPHGVRRRRSLVPGTVRNSVMTGRAISSLERAGRPFEAAWFFQQTICMFLARFRRRVPYLVAMDGTPLWYARHGLWYAQHRFDPRSLASRLRHRLTRRIYREAFQVLPLSTGVARSLAEDYDVPPERITVMPPTVDLERFTPPPRGEGGRGGGRLRVLFVGADFERKGGDLLVRLAREAPFREVDFDLVSRSCRLEVPANVRIHDRLDHDSPALVELFARADIFVLPTRADSHSIASLEAMAMGLPVVTTPVGGIVDAVVDEETGYLVPPDDLGALAYRLVQLRDDADLRRRLGEAGRRRVEARFALAPQAEVLAGLLRAAAAR